MTEKKNICITINSLDSGGAEKQSLLLAKALKSYHNTILVILNPLPVYPPRLTVIEEEGLNHIYLSKNTIKKTVEFTRLLKKRKIDIIFSFLPTDTIFAAICGKIAGVPYVFGGIRNSHMAWVKYASLRLINNYLLNYTIANNYAAYKSATAFGFKERVMVVHNGIEIRTTPQRQKLANKTINIISVGRLVKQKEYKTAIKSIATLKKILGKNYILKYQIVGQGPEQSNILLDIEKYSLQNEVELVIKPSDDIYTLLEASDIYLCTSTFEGISNSILEAMNAAMPIVATDAGDNSYLVIEGKNGFITAIHDYKKLANRLSYLIESPNICNQMGLESYNHMVKNFSYDAFQKKYLNIIKNVEAIQIHNGEFRLSHETSYVVK